MVLPKLFIMKNFYSISIPKPCHENWNEMSPKEKGRFCNSCEKTVIDFTKMNSYEIQNFIDENKNNRICGHFKQTQLDSINLFIPSKVLENQKKFHKIFLLALLIVMGTTLMNCTNKNGNKQKIDSIEILDEIKDKTMYTTFGLPYLNDNDIDSLSNKVSQLNPKKTSITNIVTDGELVIETVGDVEFIEKPPVHIDSINVIAPPEFEKEMEVMGDMMTENTEIVLGFIQVQTPPEFKNTPTNLSVKEKKEYFSKQITNIISKNFNTSVCLELKGKQRINVQFKIDSLGYVKDIKVRAPHSKLEEEAKRVIQLLSQFIPAKHKGKPVKIVYTLPIIFQVEE